MTVPSPVISEARTAEDYAAFGEVCRAYVEWCRDRYRAIPWLVEEVFGYQSFAEELQALPEKYGPPAGRALIARLEGNVVGGGAYRWLSDEVCELKRLFVIDRARGLKLGRALTERLIAAAKRDGFTVMRLDTGDLMEEALGLYGELGFVRIAPYIDYPERLRSHLIFLERPL